MNGTRQLSAEDVFFVGGEISNVYQHTAGLVIIDGEGRPDFGPDSIDRHLRDRLGLIPHLRWRLHEVPLGLDHPYWVEDTSFSFDNHIRRIALPSPGDREALASLASHLYSRHLDRRRPLWDVWIIEGLDDDRLALFSRIHHCMMDGEGANQLGMAINDLEPDPDAPLPIDPSITEARPGEVPRAIRQAANIVRNLAILPARATRDGIDAVASSARDVATGRRRGQRARTPLTMINGPLGRERGFAFGTIPLADVKAVKDRHGVTVNDVLLTLVAGTVRQYLLDRDALPQDSLRTSMAVSLRDDSDDFSSNKISAAAVTLATDVEDPVERLRAIAEDASRAKADARGGGKGVLEMMGLFPPVVVGAIVAAAPPGLSLQAAGVNLLVSNVRGSSAPLYIGGGRVTAMYPMSVLASGVNLNYTCISYVDDVVIGLTTDLDRIDGPWFLVDDLAHQLELLGRPTQKST